jgi:hypothetical protein
MTRLGDSTPAEKRAILEHVKEECRREGARDALVNLKKFIRESPGSAKGIPEAIRLIDDFMTLQLGRFIQS